MHLRFFCIFLLLAFSLSSCTGYKMGEVLNKPQTATEHRLPNRQEICVNVALKDNEYAQFHKHLVSEVTRATSHVFNRYGWKVSQNTSAPMAVNLSVGREAYIYPGWMLLYFAGLGTLPAKDESYYTVTAQVVVNDTIQEEFTYTGNSTGYMTCYGPIALLMPGVTHRGLMETKAPSDLRAEILQTVMEHIAEDLRAKYFSGNFQHTTI